MDDAQLFTVVFNIDQILLWEDDTALRVLPTEYVVIWRINTPAIIYVKWNKFILIMTQTTYTPYVMRFYHVKLHYERGDSCIASSVLRNGDWNE